MEKKIALIIGILCTGAGFLLILTFVVFPEPGYHLLNYWTDRIASIAIFIGGLIMLFLYFVKPSLFEDPDSIRQRRKKKSVYDIPEKE